MEIVEPGRIDEGARVELLVSKIVLALLNIWQGRSLYKKIALSMWGFVQKCFKFVKDNIVAVKTACEQRWTAWMHRLNRVEPLGEQLTDANRDDNV